MGISQSEFTALNILLFGMDTTSGIEVKFLSISENRKSFEI
jgi:hypothetical protein